MEVGTGRVSVGEVRWRRGKGGRRIRKDRKKDEDGNWRLPPKLASSLGNVNWGYSFMGGNSS